MRFCTRCGAQLGASSAFCTSCGAPVRTEAAPGQGAASPPPPPEPTAPMPPHESTPPLPEQSTLSVATSAPPPPAPPASPPASVPAGQDDDGEPAVPKRRRTGLVAAAVVVVVALIGGGIFLLTRSHDTSETQVGDGGSSGTATSTPKGATPGTTAKPAVDPSVVPRSATPDVATDTTPAGDPVFGGALRVALGFPVDSIDLTQPRTDVGWSTLARLLCDPLVAYDAQGRARPYALASITPNGDLTVWTLTLRSGLTFSDGSTAAASDVKATLDRLRQGGLTKAELALVTDVTVSDATTVKVTTSKPWAVFPSTLAGLGFLAKVSSGTSSAPPTCTGPFTLQSQTGGVWTFQKNPNYWRSDSAGRKLPYLDSVVVDTSGDQSTREQALSSGSTDLVIDWTGAVATSAPQSVTDNGETADLTIALNSTVPPFDDATMRKAANDALADLDPRVLNTLGAPASDQPVAPKSPFEAKLPPRDIESARKAVESYTAAKGAAPSVKLRIGGDVAGLLVAQGVQTLWKAVGFQVEIEQTDQAKLLVDALSGKSPSATLWTSFGGIDPDTFTTSLVSSASTGQLSLNVSRLNDDQITQLLDQGRSTNDDAARTTAYQSLMKRLDEVVPYVFIARRSVSLHAAANVHGLTNGPLPDGSASMPLEAGVLRLATTWISSSAGP